LSSQRQIEISCIPFKFTRPDIIEMPTLDGILDYIKKSLDSRFQVGFDSVVSSDYNNDGINIKIEWPIQQQN